MQRSSRAWRLYAAALVVGATVALAGMVGVAAGCTPQPTSDAPNSGKAATAAEGQDASGSASAEGAELTPINWTVDTDCAICHVTESAGAQNPACAQAVAHEQQVCVDCHRAADELSSIHAAVTIEDRDKVPTKAKHATADPESCIECHGTLEEVASLTSGSTALTDSQGTVVNPHERPAGESHETNPALCTDCHNNHSQDLPKDAMKYCAQCHHRGVFQCGTCHELRER